MSAAQYILKKANITTGNQLIYYLSIILWIAVYTVMSFSLALLLSERLSIFYVGLFTGLSSVCSIFIDIPIGYAQKIMRPRTLMVISSLMILATIIIFIGSIQNILLAFIATTVYGLAQDVYDITALTYIFQKSNPKEYAQNISQKNVAEAMGVLMGLCLASFIALLGLPELWVLLAFSAVITFGLFLFFDKAEYEIPVTELDIKMFEGEINMEQIKSRLSEFTATPTNPEQKEKAIILKPIAKETYNENAIIKEFKDAFAGIKSIFTPILRWPLVWGSMITLFYSLWDTFVITFQPVFITRNVITANHLNPAYAGLIIGLFVIPLFVLQVPFAKLADKFGKQYFMIGGLLFSTCSMILFGISTDIFVVILGGFLNSIGYAAAFPAAQAFFAQRFQENYAITHNSQTMDTNVSASPIKLMLNSGNVLASLLGGALIALLDFSVTFLVMGAIVFGLFLFSLIMYRTITKPIAQAPLDAEPPTQNPPAAATLQGAVV